MRNKSKWTQTTDNTTLSHIHPLLTIKEKFKIPLRCVIEEETKELGEKLFCDLSSRNWSTRELSWSTWITKDPSSLIYPMYLSPSSSYYQLASQNLVFSSFPDSTIQLDCICQWMAHSNASQQHLNLTWHSKWVW